MVAQRKTSRLNPCPKLLACLVQAFFIGLDNHLFVCYNVVMEINFTKEELAAIAELGFLQELTPQRVIVQALRVYQAKVLNVNLELSKKATPLMLFENYLKQEKGFEKASETIHGLLYYQKRPEGNARFKLVGNIMFYNGITHIELGPIKDTWQNLCGHEIEMMYNHAL